MNLCKKIAVSLLFANLIYSEILPEDKDKQSEKQSERTRRMVGGYPANIRDFPHMMSILKKERNYLGTFSLITYETAIGAAHIINSVPIAELTGNVGSNNKFKGLKVEFSERVIHPNYNCFELNNDIALLILKRPLINIPNVSPVALPFPNRKYITGTAKMVGWGNVEGNNRTSYLRQADVNLQEPVTWKYAKPDEPLTGLEIIQVSSTVHAMPGDSGSALIYTDDQGNRLQIGILCYSLAEFLLPDVYMSTSVYYNFIKERSKGELTFY